MRPIVRTTASPISRMGTSVCRAAWHWVSHANVGATAPACLFQFNDEPAVRALGLWREDAGD